MSLRSLVVCAVFVALVSPHCLEAAARRRAATSGSTIVIGALFSITGDGATLGNASAAALDLAVRDINAEFDELHLPYHVQSIVSDTKLTPSIAAARIADLYAAGANVVMGPQTSSEAAAVKDYANQHSIVLVSQASTASSLAIAGDYLFRFAPNDKLEGAAMSALMVTNGIDLVIPMWRADAGNTGLHDSTKRSFEAAGGVFGAGVSYDPTTSNFTPLVATLGAAVRTARSQNPNAHIAVYLASFEEAALIFNAARLDHDLSMVRWYGGDGVVQSQALLNSTAAAEFGAMTAFTAPNVGLDESLRDRWEPLSNEIKAKVGFQPDAYALNVYDAAWVAALATVESRYRTDVRAAFVRNVQRYWGVTGPTALDDNGDRKIGNFDFWTIKDTAGTLDWERTAQYASGRIVP